MCDYRTMTTEGDWADLGERLRQVSSRGARGGPRPPASGLSQEDLARLVDLDRTMIAKIEAGSRKINALELTALCRALGVPLSHLLEPTPAPVSRRASPAVEPATTATARHAQRVEATLLSWLRDVRQLVALGLLTTGSRVPPVGPVTSAPDARAAALAVRRHLEQGSDPIPSMSALCERLGQHVLVTHLPGDGASLVDDGLAVAVISGTDDPGRRRATAAHELGHLIVGDEYSTDLGVHASRVDRESVVDAFAAELLLPTEVLRAAAGSGRLARAQLVELAARFRTSWTLALRQADHAGVLESGALPALRRSTPTRAEIMDALGWAPQPDLESVRVPPGYARAVLQARHRGLVTTSRAVELMHGQLQSSDFPALDEEETEP
jgi:Zn-dependent peptidase ImmA (M78 family)/transcriptional regulator with XRE-family HTH domain